MLVRRPCSCDLEARSDDDLLPLFHTIGGAVVDKAKGVATIAPLAQDIGQEAVESDGTQRWAQCLAAIGIELLKFQLMACWENEVSLRYVIDAFQAATFGLDKPIKRDAAMMKPPQCTPTMEEICAEIKIEGEPMKDAESARMRAPSVPAAARSERAAIRNPSTRVFHSAQGDRRCMPPSMWHTTCTQVQAWLIPCRSI